MQFAMIYGILDQSCFCTLRYIMLSDCELFIVKQKSL